MSILAKIFGSRNDRMLRKLKPRVTEINQLEKQYQVMTDEQLASQTSIFKTELSNGKTLDDILPNAFAVVREASLRTLKMRHFDVQLIGGIALHNGWVAEAKTGEGKTLMATLPAYLNALSGKSVHIIVPNSYLAQRDADWMGQIFRFLGMTVGAAINEEDPESRFLAYQSDVVYTTNNTLGFDYLRDNMRTENHHRMLGELNFCIVDEVDSILIDDARTPLIINGPSDESSELYEIIYKLVDQLSEEANEVSANHKDQQVSLTDSGCEKMEAILHEAKLIQTNTSLYDLENSTICHYVRACLKGKYLKQRDHHYVVDHDGITIIDESSGRKAAGRRWSDGIHQALEAKEGLPVQQETQTLASITYQNLFRVYTKLSGMTGTADTEAAELKDIYGLEVLVIPPNKKMARKDLTDIVYLSMDAKTKAILAEIETRHKTGQPILVGTASIEYSEYLSTQLTQKSIQHTVLNAKHHEKEASIIAQAGCLNSVTIATNMAGRGTDIILGGCPKNTPNWKEAHQAVIDAGGLHVLGTERHESRRIDNQLRGRSGRQGDIGSSQFYLSLDDRLIKYFASEKVVGLLKSLGDDDEPLSANMLSRSIENAQKNVESKYYDARKELLKMDDAANQQRKIIYQQREELLQTEDVSEVISHMIGFCSEKLIQQFTNSADEIDSAGLAAFILSEFAIDLTFDTTDSQKIQQHIQAAMQHCIQAKGERVSEQDFKRIEQRSLLMSIDVCWKEHLSAMDHLRQGIGFRGMAQKNPAHEFKNESFILFETMLSKIKHSTIKNLCRLTIQPKPQPKLSGNYSINITDKGTSNEKVTN